METLRLVRVRLNQLEGRPLRDFTYQDVVEYQELTHLETFLLSDSSAN